LGFLNPPITYNEPLRSKAQHIFTCDVLDSAKFYTFCRARTRAMVFEFSVEASVDPDGGVYKDSEAKLLAGSRY
jgi:hypothetical protein